MTLKEKRVLYISYNGMLDPLGQSQVIPYLRELSKRGVQFTLLSFERAGNLDSDGVAKCKELHTRLAEDGIEWDWLRYHQKPSLPATAYDVLQGIRYAGKVVRRNKIELVHARSHIPAMIALNLKQRFGIRMIFDVRGLMADEYVDAEHWRKEGIPYRLTKSLERRALANADGIVTLTEKIWPVIKSWDALKNRDIVHEVIPCCADLEQFKFDHAIRKQLRADLGLLDRFVITYSGSIGGWYFTERMADFFAAFLKRRTNAHFLWLTLGSAEMISNLMAQRNIPERSYTVRAVALSEVASYLSASDVGVAFYKPGFSRMATSPVKVTEYLACGLPIIINAGIGDSDALVANERIGALIRDFNEVEYEQAIMTIEELTSSSGQIRRRTREVAERLFDIRKVGAERYGRMYEALLNSVN